MATAEPTLLDPPSAASTVVAGRPRGAEMPHGGLILGRYRLSRPLGTGGFGTVWLAWDERLEREVALKVLPRERIASGRFEREARAAARLNHPGIVILYEAAVDDEGGYLVSELVRGDTLARLVHDGRLSDRDVVQMGVALCDALEYAHHQGVIHRDVKPSNVLMPDSPSTSSEVAKLTDFGVARVVGGDSLTRTGDVVGTTAYMAPEQAAGREADPAADLYSLALVIYEGLAGVNPLRLTSPSARGHGRLGVYLPALRRRRRELPRELGCAIDLALRPRPRERGTILELRAALMVAADQVEDLPGGLGEDRHMDRAFSQPATAPPASPGFAEQRPVAEEHHGEAAAPQPIGGIPRLLAALAAAAAAAWFATAVLSPAPALPALAMLGAGLLVAILPRLGWLALTLVAIALLVGQDSVGGAILLVAVSLPTILLLVRRPARWALPALVPPLAVLGLAGAWPAVAARASTTWQRFVLGAAGWVWLVAGQFLDGRASYFRMAPGVPAPRLWMSSLYDTVHQVLHPLLYSGILAPALVWGAGAIVLPELMAQSNRSPAVRALLALGWAGALTLATRGVLLAVAPGTSLQSSGVLLGALLCGLLAVLPGPARRPLPAA